MACLATHMLYTTITFLTMRKLALPLAADPLPCGFPAMPVGRERNFPAKVVKSTLISNVINWLLAVFAIFSPATRRRQGKVAARGLSRRADTAPPRHGGTGTEGAPRRAARCFEPRVAVEDGTGRVMRDRDQLLVRREIGKPQCRQAALSGSQRLAGTAQFEIRLGDAEAVLGLAQDFEAAARHPAERRLVQQQTGRGGAAAADAAAQLVQLGEAEAFGMLHDHDIRLSHVDADLGLLGGFHAAVHEAAATRRQRRQRLVALARRGEIGGLAFLDRRAGP